MSKPPNGLTSREIEILELLSEGHEAKSIAKVLGLSVHTVNERLRNARVKLGATSSREAARRMMAERDQPKTIGYKEFGVTPLDSLVSDDMASLTERNWTMMGLAIGIFATVTAGMALTAKTAPVPPRVVATQPAMGSEIASGRFSLSVTYSEPMKSNSFSFATGPNPAFPKCGGRPIQSSDKRTFTLNCSAEVGKSYEVWFNYGQYQNFRSAKTSLPATPTALRFRVKPN